MKVTYRYIAIKCTYYDTSVLVMMKYIKHIVINDRTDYLSIFNVVAQQGLS